MTTALVKLNHLTVKRIKVSTAHCAVFTERHETVNCFSESLGK